MNPSAIARIQATHAPRHLPTAHGTSASSHHTAWHTPPQRLPVWDQRARNMGFPPSCRER
jgi:hypothetical protein